MASSQKKTAAKSNTKKTSGKKSASAQTKKAATVPERKVTENNRKSAPEQQAKPIRREVWGVICLLLGFFGFITFFKVDALFINLFRDLLGGLVGLGMYAFPPMFLLAAYILIGNDAVGTEIIASVHNGDPRAIGGISTNGYSLLHARRIVGIE